MDALHIHWDIGNAGAWGDTFGALNALFTATASIGVLWTLALQRRQLRDQSLEMQAQRAHLNASERSHNVQRFERTFFELLHLLRQEREGLHFRYSDAYIDALARRKRRVSSEPHSGALAVRAALREARYWLGIERRVHPLTRQRAAHVYALRIHGRYEGSLGPYFRLIYTLLRNIKEDEWMTEEERIRYARLLRSQLTSHEAGLVGVNALANFSKDLSDLVTEYRLLKYASAGTKGLLQNYYDASAFRSRGST
ncbi:putative phage abortive infection protein [Aurantimonas coralicida]|uniref:putative phage abortive infection protein n=1 Tax=Aurantimonas coralicida TaxID=182270 RepID=UPI00357103C0